MTSQVEKRTRQPTWIEATDMRLKVILGTPGNRREIFTALCWDAPVPRAVDLVTMDGVTREVHHVEWDLTDGLIIVYLNE